MKRIKQVLKNLLPRKTYKYVAVFFKGGKNTAIGKIKFGQLRRLKPFSNRFGYDRGLPLDRFYIERFLQENASDIRGKVLEVGDNNYTLRFGDKKVSKSDILDVRVENTKATIIADIARAEHVPSNEFDCIIFTQTLLFIYDLNSAVGHLHRMLKPGGVLLATLPGICPKMEKDWLEYWYWGFTNASAKKLFGEVFSQKEIEVEAFGNVLTTTAFLYGLATEDLLKEEIEFRDEAYDLLITVRAVKSEK